MQMAKASVPEMMICCSLENKGITIITARAGRQIIQKDQLIGKERVPCSGKRWSLKDPNQHRSWPGRNFKQKETNSGNPQHEARNKIVCTEYALTSSDGDTLEGGIAATNYSQDWIIDSDCSRHLTGGISLVLSRKEHKGNKTIVTADSSIHLLKNEEHVQVKTKDSDAGQITLNYVQWQTKKSFLGESEKEILNKLFL
ncbi:hypothetical protein POM88_034440 [Heracleum sosnowskyi]|uniref:Uncharacterized protein n=1 Tax=Heracleum sosnowskyi TaxID=360622 RepID=A0AAD8HKC7_9APIA|nr:hypothetical protein POM88_034440 [Heracleum sosnowskyi]